MKCIGCEWGVKTIGGDDSCDHCGGTGRASFVKTALHLLWAAPVAALMCLVAFVGR